MRARTIGAGSGLAVVIAVAVAVACGASSGPRSSGGGGGGGGGGAAWLLEDFSTYSNTANFLADPRGIYSTAEDEATTQMTLDKSTGVNIDGYALTQSVRYDYNAPACTS